MLWRTHRTPADDAGGVEHDAVAFLALDFSNEQANCHFAHFYFIQIDRRQGRVYVFSENDVVHTHDGDLVGHADAAIF